MLKIDNHNVNFSGQSVKDDVVLASFNASSYGNPELHMNVNIVNYEMDAEAKEMLFADMQSFCEAVINKVSSLEAE
jgi:hypothetical protein